MTTHETFGLRMPKGAEGAEATPAPLCNAGRCDDEVCLLHMHNDLVMVVGVGFNEGARLNTPPFILVNVSNDFQKPAALKKPFTCHTLIVLDSLVLKELRCSPSLRQTVMPLKLEQNICY